MSEFVCLNHSFIQGKKLTSLSHLRELERITEPPLNGTICDVMWSDPLLEDILV